MDPTSKQSWPSATVDLGIILAIIVLAFHKADGQVWFVLSQIALVRFGVAVHKTASGTIAQLSGGGGGGGGPSSGGGSGSGQMRSVQVPPETPHRNESTFPRAPRMSPALIPSTLIAVAVILSAAISLAAR